MVFASTLPTTVVRKLEAATVVRNLLGAATVVRNL